MATALLSTLLPIILPSLMSGVGSLFGSKGGGGPFTRAGEEKRFERFTPEQQELTDLLRNILTGQGEQPSGGILGDLFGKEGFDSFARPALRAYHEEIVPGLAERFTGLGAQKSSGFQQALTKSGENLATRLGEVRGQQQQGALGSLLGQVMQPQFHTQYTPGGPTGLAQGLSGLAGGLGSGGVQGLLSNILGGLR